MRLTQFGETVLPELNGNDDLSQTARSNLVPLKYGAIDLDNSEVVLDYKRITRTAVINTNFDTTMDDLAYESQKGARVLKAEMRDGTERQLLAKMNVFSRGARADKYTCEQEFGLQWTATYPYWLLSEHEPYYTNHGYTTADGLTTGDGNYVSTTITGVSTSFTITNASRVRIPKIYFNYVMNGTSSAVNRPLLTNTTNGMYLYLDVSLTNGAVNTRSVCAIDCLAKRIYGAFPDGIGEHNYYHYLTTNPSFMDWMILEPGDNDFVLTYTALGGSDRRLVTHWSNHYV